MASIGTLNLNFETNVATLINDMRKASRSVETSSNRMNRSLKTATLAFKGLAIGFAAGFSGRALVRAVDDVNLLSSRIKQSTRNTQEFEVALKGLKSQAASISGDLGAGVEIFQRLSFSRSEIGSSVEEMLQFTETVQKLGVVSGASTTALNAGLLQLGQGLSAGVLRAEEFNSILENIPGVANAISKEMGVTVGQLRALVLEGEVLSQDVFAAILNQTKVANEQFEKMPQTIARATQQLGLQIKLLVSGFDDATGSSSALAGVINAISQAVKGLGASVRLIVFGFETLANVVALSALKAVNALNDGVNKLIESLNRLPKVNIPSIPRLTPEEIDLYGEATDLQNQSFKDLVDGINSIFPAQEAVATSTRSLSKDYEALAQTITDSGTKSKVAAKSAADGLGGVKTAVGEAFSEFDDFGSSVQSTFIDFVTGATDAKGALRSLVNELQRSFLKTATGGSGGGIFDGLIGGLFKGFGSSGGSGGFNLGSLFSGFSIPGFAKGGISTQPAIFGEAGAEAAVPLPDGRTIPVTLNGGGSGGDTYYIDAKGADQAALSRLENTVRSLNGSVERRAISAVADMNRRNPNLLST